MSGGTTTSSPLHDLQIPPARSPLLLPTDRQRASRANSRDSSSSRLRSEERDVLEDLEFLAPSQGSWEEQNADYDDDDGNDSDESLEDFSLDDGHIVGVPAAACKLDAKQYQTPEFATTLLYLLRDDLKVPGWETLPYDLPSALLDIRKISGALTNAVFFVSVPAETFEVTSPPSPEQQPQPASPIETPVAQRHPLHSLAAHLENENGRATPTPSTINSKGEAPPTEGKTTTIHIEAPTILLRVYGPSSGSLISRKTELHVLHTLSSDYHIGPQILGTFSNGRVEEYFQSRALHKEEMRDVVISRCIGRRMRELHRVDLARMELPDGPDPMASSGELKRPSLEGKQHAGGSGGSIYSTSSGSSVFSFGTSFYSNSSAGSTASLATTLGDDGSQFGTPIVNSPMMMPRRGSSEIKADAKRRSRSMSVRSKKSKERLGAWENITRWTREAKLVLKELDGLASLKGFSEYVKVKEKAVKELKTDEHVVPLTSPALTLSLREELNLPLFEQQVKLYRSFVREWEKREGKSKRVFAHNDTQYGNLLIEAREDEEEAEDPSKTVIHCIDFEYSSANPRGYDIANHFIEWRADYHHPTLSHSVVDHGPYPNPDERRRFLRAYVGCDGGKTARSVDDEPSPSQEDSRVLRLEDEVKVWQPASHALWSVWGIVQAKEDILARVDKWKKACAKRSAAAGLEKEVRKLDLEEKKEVKEEHREGLTRPGLTRGKSGETVDGDDGEEEETPVEFDYLSYALGRVRLFRAELKQLGIVD